MYPAPAFIPILVGSNDPKPLADASRRLPSRL